jgi:acrylyl-CoA reductase (NADPH)
MFQALYIDKQGDDYQCALKTLQDEDFPEHGDVIVRVDYSTLNFKDGLAITGSSPVVRSFPMVPGIDFAGVVESSQHPDFSVGQRVLINGWGLGEKYWGGLAQKAKVPGEWLLPVPATLSNFDVMAIGTAGYTAMLSVLALEKQGVLPQNGPILVTGANGGVGGFAVAFLAKLGYQVVASTGRPEEGDRLYALGASEIIERQSLSQPGRPLAKERWAGVIDSVGSHTLANACASTVYGGVVTACGLAQGMDFPASVAPFILRGVTLVGIDSVMCPMDERHMAWEKIADLVDSDLIAQASRVIGMSEVIETAQALLAGKVAGRVVVDVNQD